MGKVLFFFVVVTLAVFGARLHSQYDLQQRVSSYRSALRTRALAPRQGVSSTPTEEDIVARAEALAHEFDLEVSELEATVTENATPTGASGMAEAQLGALQGRAQADAEGNVVQGPARRLRTTRLEVHARVRAKGFLCAIEESAEASANLGYALE